MKNSSKYILKNKKKKKINHLIEIVESYISASKRDNTQQWTLVYEMQKVILEDFKNRL